MSAVKKVSFFLIFICISFFSIGQSKNETFGNVVFEIQKKINEINRRLKIEKNKKPLALKFEKLKMLFDNNYDKYTSICYHDSTIKKSFTVILNVLINDETNIKTISEIIEDLNAKNSIISLGLNVNTIIELPVEVMTVDSTLNPVSGYYVYWNFWLDKDNLNPASNFNNFTNPTSLGFLNPGIYDIWVRKGKDYKRFPDIKKRIKQTIQRSTSETATQIKIIVE